jgi:imidazole glycerol-phosphate synthase subunit HisF
MVKKRLIFTLLYDDGCFMLSRNFRLQRAGNIDWLTKNYDFRNISTSIDELIILDVSRKERNTDKFIEHIKTISKSCFIPIAAGGGILDRNHAELIIKSGADKLVINSALNCNPSFVKELIGIYGSQCIVASIDVKKKKDDFEVYTNNGTIKVEISLREYIKQVKNIGIGEIYLNSMDMDGTGHGYAFDIIEKICNSIKVPIIIAGGAGNWHHLLESLQHNKVDAAATANLFNFIGQGFPTARKQLLRERMNLAEWNSNDFKTLNKEFNLSTVLNSKT